MHVVRVQNNNNNTVFGQKLKFDAQLISRATSEEKSELAILKKLFKDNGIKGEISVNNDKKVTIQTIIDNLKLKFNETGK